MHLHFGTSMPVEKGGVHTITSGQPNVDAIATGIWRDDGVEFEQGLSTHSFGLPRQEGALGVSEADAPSPEPVLEQPVVGLKEFDDDQLMTMNPASDDHQ